MNSFTKKFSFLSLFLDQSGDDQAVVEQQIKAFYPQELLNISQFIGDKDYDTTLFLWIGFSFTQEAKKSFKLFKKTLDALNALSQNTRPDLEHAAHQVSTPRQDATQIQQLPQPSSCPLPKINLIYSAE